MKTKLTFLILTVALLNSCRPSDSLNMVDENNKKQGHWIHYGKEKLGVCFKPDQKMLEGNYKDDKKTGPWTEYYCNNKIRSIVNFLDGKPNGTTKKFYESGKIQEEGIFINYGNSSRYFASKYYSENGQIMEHPISEYKN